MLAAPSGTLRASSSVGASAYALPVAVPAPCQIPAPSRARSRRRRRRHLGSARARVRTRRCRRARSRARAIVGVGEAVDQPAFEVSLADGASLQQISREPARRHHRDAVRPRGTRAKKSFKAGDADCARRPARCPEGRRHAQAAALHPLVDELVDVGHGLQRPDRLTDLGERLDVGNRDVYIQSRQRRILGDLRR